MGLRSVSLSVTIPAAALRGSLPDAMARLLTASAATWFRPYGACGSAGAAGWRVGAEPFAARWPDEVHGPDQVLSRSLGAAHAEVVAAIAARMASAGDGPPELTIWGATAASPTPGAAPEWLARWWPDQSSGHALVSLRLLADPVHVQLWIRWVVWGFPLSAVAPTAPSVSPGDPHLAWHDRARVLPAVAAAVAELGAPPDACTWAFDVELGYELRTVGGADLGDVLVDGWLPALRTGAALAYTEPPPIDEGAAILDPLHGSLEERVAMLSVLMHTPSVDPRVVAALEGLTDDQRPCRLQVPLRYGPVALLAELVLARTRAALGMDPRAFIWSPPPLTATEIERREVAAGLPPLSMAHDPDAPNAVVLARYQRLRDHGALDEEGHAIDHHTAISDLAPPEPEWNAPAARPDAAVERAPDPAALLAGIAAGGERRAWALEDVLAEPLDDDALLAAVTQALDDRTPCSIDGAHVGEIRLLAAATLAALRHRRGEPMPVDATFTPPMSTQALMDARRAHPDGATAPRSDDFDERHRLFAWLRERGVLPQVRRTLHHPVDLAALAVARSRPSTPDDDREP